MQIARETVANPRVIKPDLLVGDADDETITISMTALGRVAMVVAEASARFARERVDIDPVDWAYAPRRMFGGRPAVLAVQEPHHFQRAMLLHRLALGLDADPEAIDALLEDDDDDGAEWEEVEPTRSSASDEPVMALYCATIVEHSQKGALYAFHASVAPSMDDYEETLSKRFGVRRTCLAVISEGFDPEDRVARVLVSNETRELLELARREPLSALARNVDVHIEQRFSF